MPCLRPLAPVAAVAAVAVGAAASLTAMVPAGTAPATCLSWAGVQPPDTGNLDNNLSAVALTSPCNAWVAGYYHRAGSGNRMQILHWNGSAWTRQALPAVGGHSLLTSVTAVSATSAWAVGYDSNRSPYRTLVLHWNGHRWSHQASPDAVSQSTLTGVTAVSATSAWAVGTDSSGSFGRALVLHWNGKTWQVQPTPVAAGTSYSLSGVTAASGSRAWAVGVASRAGGSPHGLILHWNGHSWCARPLRVGATG